MEVKVRAKSKATMANVKLKGNQVWPADKQDKNLNLLFELRPWDQSRHVHLLAVRDSMQNRAMLMSVTAL